MERGEHLRLVWDLRGASWDDDSGRLASSSSLDYYANPTYEYDLIGFRVASTAPIPEPTSIALLLAAAVALGIWRLRRKA